MQPGHSDAFPGRRDQPRVVLASRSPYRRELLGRLLDGFIAAAADLDETPRPGEAPAATAARLAEAKARAVGAAYPGALVIGSDQVAALGPRVLGKPGTADRAVEQLLACAGREVVFHTAVCLIGPGAEPALAHLDNTTVRFRSFGRPEAERYVEADQPLDCAGSFKAERRGVVLMESIESRDPTAIQGLPLIWVAAALRQRGISIP